MTDRLNTDSLRASRDEALEFMAHHLRLACIFYELIEDDEATEIKLMRLLRGDDARKIGHEPNSIGGFAFKRALDAYYEKLRLEQGD